ncbi:Acetoin catabolism regulatory protein [Janthinobacterium lividum]|uniref:sigma-54-dependent Fis family transcriptional regulator n=1 Tax=Janthinobacterium lividum TaxID=29581 RepID=UPI000E02908E|nr:sigma 54-interacting transcriptional regulator [Janthinobacterium lividum]STR25380.1 Acetoin catabolism regulatory protein [Janthinobacterium lividum]
MFQLGLSFAALQSHTFSSLFGLPVSALYDHYRTASPGLLNLCMHSGVRVYGRAQLRLANSAFQHGFAASTDHSDINAAPAQVPAPASHAANAARRLSGLRYLRTGDPQLELVIEKVNKVLGRDIPILVMGETGTGKELLAQAIHNDSPRAMGPFIAVNCASIPETLIESELFGYEDGAFTGARKKGAIGKILQANGGTLFLDEIGDMPFGLQARLLRVLQERMVTRWQQQIDHRECGTYLRHESQLARTHGQGAVREDLYYRLNGLVVKLPPLRERTDLDTVVKKILATEAPDTRYTVAPDILRLFTSINGRGTSAS